MSTASGRGRASPEGTSEQPNSHGVPRPAIEPDSVECANLGVRCALVANDDIAFERATKAVTAAPANLAARYWYALAAAHAGHDTQALEAVVFITAADPDSDTTLDVTARVDLAVSRRRHHRAVVAEQAITKMLARNPADANAHNLHRHLRYTSRRVLLKRPGDSEQELHDVVRATAAGVQPSAGELAELTHDAIWPAGLTVLMLVLYFVGALLVEALGGVLTALLAGGAWLFVYGGVWRPRLRRVIDMLPGAARRRLLRPVVTSAVVGGGVMLVIGSFVAADAIPLTREHAADKYLQERTVVTVVYDTVPGGGAQPPVFPQLDPFGNGPALPGVPSRPTFPPIPLPTPPPIQVPVTRRIEARVGSAEHAWQELLYVAVMSWAMIVFGAIMLWHALSLRRVR